MSTATVVLICLGVVMVINLWVAICNHFTYKLRMKLIAVIYRRDNANYHEDRKVLDSVSYDKHLWTMATFRNPLKLYPQHIQDAMK